MKHHADILSPTEHSLEERPSQDHGERFSMDQKIRDLKRGYQIKHRPVRGEAIWEKKGLPGVEFTQSDVIRRECLDETDAEMRERMGVPLAVGKVT
jgi:hypothetical protein